MNRPDRAASYADVLRLPGVGPAFAAATLGRLSYATVSLALLITVHDATRSYAAAGSALGAFGLASVTMPVKSRLIDRLGQARVLPVLSIAFAGSLIAASLATYASISTALLYVTLAVLAGLTAPPLGPSMRALWASLTPDPAVRQRAYSLDAVVEEVLFGVGPLLVGAMVLVSTGPAALLGTAVLNLLGGLGMARAAPRQASPATAAYGHLLGPFRQPGFGLLAVALVGAGLGGGPLEVAVVARTQEQGHPAAVGSCWQPCRSAARSVACSGGTSPGPGAPGASSLRWSAPWPWAVRSWPWLATS